MAQTGTEQTKGTAMDVTFELDDDSDGFSVYVKADNGQHVGRVDTFAGVLYIWGSEQVPAALRFASVPFSPLVIDRPSCEAWVAAVFAQGNLDFDAARAR